MPNPRTLSSRDPVAVAVTAAIVTGDLDALRGLLVEHPGLAGARVVEDREGCGPGGRSLLHLATDWPGHRPRGRRPSPFWSRPAPTRTPASPVPTGRPPCTGRRATTTSR
ncbi:hypothetical protein [Streptomyces sp. NPDC058583]|uniref:hypothetical protein n=1 Tax=unclassified Streptomyces TaxID=2593676 RepID=UPI003667EAF3